MDFSKAFESVWRVGLWQKLQNSNIDRKFITLIRNMYSNIKSCISNGNDRSDYFTINCGVRQVENLSPILFSLYLNDLEEFLSRLDNPGFILHDGILDTTLKY